MEPGAVQDVVGNTVCSSGIKNPGITRNENCGVMFDKMYRPASQFCNCFRQAYFKLDSGDSGSAVYTYGYNTRWASGIGKGYRTYSGGSNAYYTHLPYALDAWGLRIHP